MGNKHQPTINSFFAPKSIKKHLLDNDNTNNQKKLKDGKLLNTDQSISINNLESLSHSISNNKNEPDSSQKTKPKESPVPNENIFYSDLCSTFDKIEATSKRLLISSLLTEYFQKVITTSTPQTLVESVYLCLNRLGPEYEGKELGIGEALLIKAIASATGRTPKAIKADVVEKGDLGLVAQNSKGKQSLFQKPKPHTIHSIFTNLQDISNMTGNQSQQKKIDRIQKMLTACSNSEPKYLIRSLEGKLRIGLAQQTILIALTHAAAKNEPEYQQLKSDLKKNSYLQDSVVTVKQVFSEIPSYDKIIPTMLVHGIKNLQKHCQLTPGIPLKPMLAHPTKSLTDVLNRFENLAFTCEYKYDGERAQIHLTKDQKTMIYSRNSENLSEKYPDVLGRIKNACEGVESFVLDCEAVAWDVKQKCILPFQVLSTRKRKDVLEKDIQVQVCIFAFDLLYLNGEALVTKSFRERRDLLHKSFKEISGEFMFAESMDSTSVEDIQTFLDASIVGNCEGLMVKTLDKDSSYEPSKRSRNWLKVKKDYVNGMGDSLDLVVIGAYNGRGKRTGAYGGYLLACYDQQKEEYQSICKLGTGFSDEDLANHYNFFKDHIISAPPSYYDVGDSPNIKPDVWFSPVAVWEIKAADLSISPVHKAAVGLVDENKGISLRFPRFIRVRDDKTPEEATDAEQVANFYNDQNLNATELVE